MNEVNNWEAISAGEQSSLKRSFQFKNFVEAWGFLNQVALLSEKANHHPNWSNLYNKVEISLTTHDKGNTITEQDILLAQKINKLLD